MSPAAIQHARDAVAAQKARCRSTFGAANTCHLREIAYACWGFHYEVRKLEQLQADLAYLERSP